MSRLALAFLALFAASATAQMLPTPPKTDTPRALDPLLFDAAKLVAKGEDWREHLLSRGGHVDGLRPVHKIAPAPNQLVMRKFAEHVAVFGAGSPGLTARAIANAWSR